MKLLRVNIIFFAHFKKRWPQMRQHRPFPLPTKQKSSDVSSLKTDSRRITVVGLRCGYFDEDSYSSALVEGYGIVGSPYKAMLGLKIPTFFALYPPDFSPCAARSYDM